MNENGTYKNLMANIWQLLDILQTEFAVNDYHFLILFLLLRKEGVFANKLFSDNITTSLKRDLYNSNIRNKELLQDIYAVYESTILKIRPGKLAEVLQIICNMDVSALKNNIAAVVDELIYKFSRNQSDYRNEKLLPFELSSFICSLIDLPKGSVVYNPLAGNASLGVHLDSKYFYYGQEQSMSAWAIGTLWLLAHRKSSHFNFINSDNITQWNPSGINFDAIIANTIFADTRRSRVYLHSNVFKNREPNLIERWLLNQDSNAKLIILVPQSFVNYQNNQSIFKDIIDKDYLESIIYFPNGVLPYASIAATLLVLNRNKNKKGKVCFINSVNYFENLNIKEKILDNVKLTSDIKKGIESDSLKYVSNLNIQEKDYSLSVPRYFTKDFSLNSNERLAKLSDIATVYKGIRSEHNTKCKFVRIKDLKNDNWDYYLQTEEINDTAPQLNSLRIDESVILLALHWKTIKPTYFKYKGSPIFINRDLLALKVDESKVDIRYLINEFHSDYVIDQLNSIRIGDVMPAIRKNDLMNILIKLTSLDEQKAKIEGIKESSVKLRLLDAERNARVHGFEKLIYEKFSTTKHSLGKPLLNINSSIKNIESALGKISPEWKSYKMSEILEETLEDTFKTIYSELSLIHNILKNSERGLDLEKYSFENIDIVIFLKDYVNRIKVMESKNIKVTIYADDIIKNKHVNYCVKGNPDLIEIALNNIVDNANKHAFLDPKKKYNLDFKLSLFFEVDNAASMDQTKDFIKIEIANNGEPFPKNFTLEKLIRKNSFAGPTGNSGIGGYDINNIVEYHKGKFDLIVNDKNSKFVTTYIIILPINIEN